MWNLSYASSQGLAYFHEGRNNQDMISGMTEKDLCLTVINDGCHGEAGSKNEVGAILSNRYLMKQGWQLLKEGLTPSALPIILFPEYLDFLNWQVEAQMLDSAEEIDRFIADYLMCTTVAIAANENETCVFWAGDGVIYLNNGLYKKLVSKNNRAKYPAYNMYKRYGLISEDTKILIDQDGIETEIPNGFDLEVFPNEAVNLIGIASDGLLNFPSLMDELRAHSGTRMSLQLCLNRIAVLRAETTDNVSVAFAKMKER